jgi:hypothetical protein
MFDRRSMLFPPACFAVATLTLAQASQNLEIPNQPMWIPLAGPQQYGIFKQSVSGDFDGDGLDDVIMRHGTKLHMLFAPGHWRVQIELPGDANDLAVLPATEGDPASLVTVGSQGLLKLVWDDASPSYWNSTLLVGGAWIGAKHMAVDASAPHAPVVYGAKPGMRMRFDVEESQSDSVDVPGEQALDIQMVRFTGASSSLELAVMKANRLDVYHAWNDLQWTYTTGDSTAVSHAFAPVKHSSLDQLLWFIRGPSGTSEYLVSLEYDAPSEPAVSWVQRNFSGLPEIVGCTSGDGDGDGDIDLLYSHKEEKTLVMLPNLGMDPDILFKQIPAGAFDHPASYVPGGGSASAPFNQAQPALTDIDNDGDLDIVFPVQEPGAIFVKKSSVIDRRDSAAKIQLQFESGGTVTQGGVSFRFTAPGLTGSERLEVLVWGQAKESGTWVTTDANYARQAPVSALESGGHWTFDVEVPVEEPLGVTLLMVRVVSAGGAAEPRFPARFYAFQVAGGEARSRVEELFEEWEGLEVEVEEGIMPLWGGGVIGVPGTVCEIVMIPNLPPDNPPRPRS